VATLSRDAAPSAPLHWTLEQVPIDDARWLTFTAAHPEALAFHRPTWTEMIADCYGYRPFALAAAASDGTLVAGVPVIELGRGRSRRWSSLPFTDFCPPLLTPGVSLDAFTLAAATARKEEGLRSFELRGELVRADGVHLHSDAFIHTTALEHDPEKVFARFHRSQVMRNVRRAKKEGLEVRHGERREWLTRDYFRLHVATRRRLGRPVQPRRLFEALWTHLIEPGFGHVLLVYKGSQPVAGAVFLSGNTVLTYKYGASDQAFWRDRPNHLIFTEAIRGACARGYAEFDWGRSDAADTGLREFKGYWAGVERPLVYSTLAGRAPAEGSGRALELAGAIIRRSPPFVCRASGELFYRYAA
jgi:CelD/BcsL family acetyltransferase involved in cellulose biosynthesis